MWRYVRNDELYHYGILGMRWGIRRYQNKDGSLTPAGKKRAAKLARKYRETVGSDVSPAIKTKRRIEDMSNEELAERTMRNQLETNYMRSLSDRKVMIKKSEPAIKKFVTETLLPNVAKSAADAMKDKVGKALGDLWEDKIAPAAGIDKYTWEKALKGAKSKADLQKELNRIIEEQAKKQVYDGWVKNKQWEDIYREAYSRKKDFWNK